jgi:hypothetical protein
MDHQVVGVLGASGGLGVSSLAVAVGLRACARFGATVCLDGDAVGGGLDVTACLEHLPGLRWPDLEAARGQIDGAALLRALPAEGSLRVLAARAAAPGRDVMVATLAALAELCPVTVVDLGRSLRLVDQCTHVVLLSGVAARHLADAAAVVPALLERSPDVRLALRAARRDPVQPEDVASLLDLPLATVLHQDPRAVTDADRARMPGARPSSVLARAAEDVVSVLALSGQNGRAAS